MIKQYPEVTFIVTPSKIYFKTKLQFFMLEPSEYYYNKRFSTIKMMIETGHIKNMDSLFSYTQHKIKVIPSKESWI